MELDEIEESLLIISFKDDDLKAAELAFSRIYYGYSKFLYGLTRSRLLNMGFKDETIIRTTVDNSFLKIYTNPLAFEVPKGETTDNSFKAWLSVVARNELLALFNEYNKNHIAIDGLEESISDQLEDESNIPESINSKTIKDALNLLSNREREILCYLMMFFEEGKKISSENLNLLCNYHGTTKDNIRQIKKRAIKKITEYVEKHTQLKAIKSVK